MMKLRDKLSRKRNVLMEDEEKPFLEHLDDLRKMLMRLITTLLISVTLCFVFNAWFFKVVQYPMERAGLASAMERNLPEGIDQAQWMQIHTAARGASVLDGPGRELFLAKAVPDVKFRAYTEAMLLYHAADLLPIDQQTAYMEEATKLLPEPLRVAAGDAGKAILKVRPQSTLEALRPVIETEAFAPAETFMLSMKLSTFAGIIISFPILFYFILEFILPGLNPRERRMMIPALAIGFGLFLLGVLSAYFYVIPTTLQWFHEYSRDLGIRDGWRIGSYIGFVTSFCLIFGVSFELPVVVMVLVKLGLLSSTTMRRTRSWAMIIIVVAAAVITPTGDILTLSMLAGPMIVMYEICIWLAVAHEKKLAREEAEESSRDMARRAALFGVASVATAHPGSRDATDHASSDHPDHPDHGHYSEAPDYHEDPHHHNDHWHGHPHHSDPDLPTADQEAETYRREHAHLYETPETHPETTPEETGKARRKRIVFTNDYETSQTHPEETPILDDTPTEGDASAHIEAAPETPVLVTENAPVSPEGAPASVTSSEAVAQAFAEAAPASAVKSEADSGTSELPAPLPPDDKSGTPYPPG